MSELQAIQEKVDKGQRLSFEDGVALYKHPDLIAIGRMASPPLGPTPILRW